ncbi:MAG TPA: hypothetical protein PK640_04170 [Verrucomicrobiota bacterium]|nr:hypothetical protein [Verrucomicrobiota bacterium]
MSVARSVLLFISGLRVEEYLSPATRIGHQECPDRDPAPLLDWIERVAGRHDRDPAHA